MPLIKKLAPELVAKISAGEVIERPVYAVKELIENALDAKATQIKIELKRAGLDKIHITDNGMGMEKADLFECFKPHTTSKIEDESDLLAIHSLGFRGEALASIATISDMIIRSRTVQDSVGTEIHIAGGKVTEESPFGMPTGSEFIVSDLFNAIPARKKFLTNSRGEFKLIYEMILSIALAHPQTGFHLIHDGKTSLDLNPQNFSQRVATVLGSHTNEHLIPVSYDAGYFTIHGFIGKPQVATLTAAKQYLYVNKRKVSDKMISLILKESYGTLLEPKSHPTFILFLDIPFERVDVNVHPRKESVAFITPEEIWDSVRRAVITALSTQKTQIADRRWQGGKYTPFETTKWTTREGGTDYFAGQLLKETVTPWALQAETLAESDVIQIHRLYIVVHTKEGLVLIDQHAAHERILYEQYAQEFERIFNLREQYYLKSPQQITLSLMELQEFSDHAHELESIGFEFTNESVLQIIAVPMLFKDYDYSELIRSLLDKNEITSTATQMSSTMHKLLSYLACKNAIKSGDAVSKDEAINLLKKLSNCQNKFTCPHGRPAQIEISLSQLDKMFHRR